MQAPQQPQIPFLLKAVVVLIPIMVPELLYLFIWTTLLTLKFAWKPFQRISSWFISDSFNILTVLVIFGLWFLFSSRIHQHQIGSFLISISPWLPSSLVDALYCRRFCTNTRANSFTLPTARPSACGQTWSTLTSFARYKWATRHQ
ncbi:hypothetical protein C8J56DRAFT_931396 [Mycena floridula]|nr:hypothetical protein C8J56DRAFT_931396 [Mycena floridula]